jgi:nucleotide-binding universal stress UspA family protein
MNTHDESGSVVVGLDTRGPLRGLLRVAGEEARLRGAPMAIVSVLRPVVDGERSPEGWQADEQQAEAVISDRLAEAANMVAEQHGDLPVTTHLLREDEVRPGLEPLTSAAVLVLGTHGRFGQPAFELQTVSRLLSRSVSCPVLVVPDAVGGRPQRRRPLVVAGIGQRASDSVVVDAAAEDAARRGADLHLLHASAGSVDEPLTSALRQGVDAVAGAMDGAGVARDGSGSPIVLLTRDDPARALCSAAEAASLLVVGSRPGSLAGLVLGSVSHAVLAAAPCPVMVIPEVATGGARREGRAELRVP